MNQTNYFVMKLITVLGLFLFFSISSFAQSNNDFTLQAVIGNKNFTLSENKGKYIVLHFLLKTECPYCIKHTSDYLENARYFPNVQQIFIKPDNKEEIIEWISKIDIGDNINFFQDEDAKLAKQLEIPGGYSFHGQLVHYPALLIINPAGKEVFRYIGKNNNDRYSFEQLTQKLKEFGVETIK